jgi:hypothetical protein
MKVLPTVANAEEKVSQPSYAEVLAAPLRGMKSPGVEDSASVLRSWLSMGGGARLTELMRSLAMEFLAKLKTEVDRILFLGLGLKIKVSRDRRRRMVQALSRLGLKPNILDGRCKHKRMSSGLVLRPKSRAKPKAGDDRATDSILGPLSCDEHVSAIERSRRRHRRRPRSQQVCLGPLSYAHRGSYLWI